MITSRLTPIPKYDDRGEKIESRSSSGFYLVKANLGISDKDEDEIAAFFADIANKSINYACRSQKYWVRDHLQTAFTKRIKREVRALQEITSRKQPIKKLLTEIHNKRNEARKKLVGELRPARKKVRELRSEIKRLAVIVAERQREHAAYYEQWFANLYPKVPDNWFIEPSYCGNGLPSEPGIYFLWLDGVVDYVGQAVRLKDRLTCREKGKGHHVLTDRHRINFVPTKIEYLNWAESYYIGILRPRQNFGIKQQKRLAKIEVT